MTGMIFMMRVLTALNEEFVRFVLYPNDYNRQYRITRVFVPVFATLDDVNKKSFPGALGASGDGILIMLMGNADLSEESVISATINNERAVIWVNNDCSGLIEQVKKYIAVKYLETQKLSILRRILPLKKNCNTIREKYPL